MCGIDDVDIDISTRGMMVVEKGIQRKRETTSSPTSAVLGLGEGGGGSRDGLVVAVVMGGRRKETGGFVSTRVLGGGRRGGETWVQRQRFGSIPGARVIYSMGARTIRVDKYHS